MHSGFDSGYDDQGNELDSNGQAVRDSEPAVQAEVARPAMLSSMDRVGNFLFAGNAIFTLKSRKSGRHFTFKVAHKKDGDVSFVSLLTGPDNTRDYSYLGLLPDDRATRLLGVGKGKSCADPDAPSAKAFQFLLDCLWTRPDLPDSLEIWHEGRCGRCGRKLTVPESIENGIGPECATKV